jgi:DNA modification methylase
MRDFAPGSFDAVITDPPYFLPAEHYKTRVKWARSLSDLSIIGHFLGDVLAECRRVLKPTGVMLTFCDGQSYPVIYAKCYQDYARLTDIVWDKMAIGMGAGVRRRHELILAGVPESYLWGGWIPSVLRFAPVQSEQRQHPAEKPIELLRELLRVFGGSVLDPFCGSGTTGVACAELGRDFVGIELDAGYCEIARKRIDAALRQGHLDLTAEVPR